MVNDENIIEMDRKMIILEIRKSLKRKNLVKEAVSFPIIQRTPSLIDSAQGSSFMSWIFNFSVCFCVCVFDLFS
jgi:hypothetical protein